MEEKELEELTINELKELAESEAIELTATKKVDIVAEINKARELVTTDNKENNQDDIDNASGEMSNKDNANDENNSNAEVDTDTTDKEMIEEADKGKKESTNEVNKEIRKDIEIPKGFIKKSNLNKKEYGYYKGRKYKKIKNGYGIWADNGQSFLLNELK